MKENKRWPGITSSSRILKQSDDHNDGDDGDGDGEVHDDGDDDGGDVHDHDYHFI